MSIEIHPSNITPDPIEDGGEALNNKNCEKKARQRT